MKGGVIYATFFIKKRIMTDVRLEAEGRQAEALINEPTIVLIGGKEYGIRAFSPYISWLISSKINKIQKAETNIESLIGVLANNIPILAEVIAIAILNDKDRIEKELEELKTELLLSNDYYKWLEYVKIIFEKIDFSFFFLITRQIEQLSTMAKKMTKQQHELLMQQRSSE
jgi:hypothetical protein